MKSMTITILGEGAWGTTLASLLAHNGHQVTLWCHHPEIATEIQTHRTNNRYMPDVALPNTMYATADMHEALSNAELMYEAIPVQYLRSVVTRMREHIKQNIPWVITSKGIEQKTLMLPSELITDTLGYIPPYAVCMGPSFARDVIKKQNTGLVIAAKDTELQKNVAASLTNDYIQCDFSTDMHGLQLCAAFKNVIALLVGISDGKGHGDNTRALLVTRCFEAMCSLITAAGGELKTVHSLGGFGDLFMTASSTQSRNYMVGRALGAGESLKNVIERTGFTPEGINAACSITLYADRYGVNLRDIMRDFTELNNLTV